MALYRTGVLIKQLRESKGITQKELSDGICAKDTLYRIEQGNRRPDWYIFEKIMQKLGEDPWKYTNDIITAYDEKILDSVYTS